MADHDSTNGPAPSPELPITIQVSGDLQAVDFIRRLDRAGLALRTGDVGYPVIVLAERAQPQEPEARSTDPLRLQLWQAAGIAHAVRHALCSDSEADHIQLQAALEAAERITDDVASALEGWKS